MKCRAAHSCAKMGTTSLSLAFIRDKHSEAVRDMDKTMVYPEIISFVNLSKFSSLTRGFN